MALVLPAKFNLGERAPSAPGLRHFWTLAIEEQFYLIWPLVVYFIRLRWLFYLSLLICFTEPFLRLACLNPGYSTWAVRHLTPFRIDSILWGAIAAMLLNDPRLLPNLKQFARALWIGAALVLAAVAARDGNFPYQGIDTEILGYTAIALIGTALIALCLAHREPLDSHPSLLLLTWLGRRSYAIYIVSVPVILAFSRTLEVREPFHNQIGRAIVRFVICGVISMALAEISWRCLERPFLSLGHKPSLLTAQNSPIEKPVTLQQDFSSR